MNSSKFEPSFSGIPNGDRIKPRNARLHDTKNFHVTLKQWRALHAVVDCGGFSGAAESLHLSQSSISYAIAKLQAQFGFSLLKINGRKAELTKEGKALLERSRNLLCDAVELEACADRLRRGQHNEIRMAIEPEFPIALIAKALDRLVQSGNHVKVALTELGAADLEETLRSRRADLAVTSRVPTGYDHVPIFQFDYVAVTNIRHRLHRLKRELQPEDFAGEVEILITGYHGQQPIERRMYPSVRSGNWCVGSIDAAIRALNEGLGFAWLPRHYVEAGRDRHVLSILPIKNHCSRIVRLELAYNRLLHASPQLQALMEMLLRVTMEGDEQSRTALA